ncbi:hypothetical protein A3K82_00685 [Candidatus Pacearchaeota archaeon RBG_19FT_COMBO_34_9]|jgi:DNA-binding Lrp family transcriptional regulator|nr:MAG: hypothetical protein A3K82_00685 [Candidatus Pacearchaeota archaeon RBG_19FT_COMBO_34_9]
MTTKRKKTSLDGTDKEILRNLRKVERGLSGSQIAKRVCLSDSSIKPRLDHLKEEGYIKDECNAFRNYTRKFNLKDKKKPVTKKVSSCSKRIWTLDFD